MASPINLSDKTKEDERSQQNKGTEYENPMSQEGDKLLSQTESKEGNEKQSSNRFNSNTYHTPHDINGTSESESEYFQNSSQSESLTRSFQNDDPIVDSPVTVQNRTESVIDYKSLRNDNAIEPILVTGQNIRQTENSDFGNDNSNNQNSRNESSPFINLEKFLANCGPTSVPLYMKSLFICVVAVLLLVITTVIITIAIVKQPCQEKPLAETIRTESAVEDLNYMVLSIWDDTMDMLNVSFFGKNDILLYQINYQGNDARNQIVVCQHGESAFSISCGEEKTNSCVSIPEYPDNNPETFPKHFNYIIDRQCIGKKAYLRWKT